MSFLKRPFRKLKEMNEKNSANNSSDEVPSTPSKTEGINGNQNGSAPDSGKGSGTSTPRLNGDSKRQSKEIIAAERTRRSVDKERVKAETKKRESMARIEDERFLEEGPAFLTKLYRPYSMNMSKRWNHEHRQLFKEIDWKSRSSEYFFGNC